MRKTHIAAVLALMAMVAAPASAESPPAQTQSEELRLASKTIEPAVPSPSVIPDAVRLQVSEKDRKAIRFVVQLHIASLSQQRADLFSKTFTKKTQEAFESADQMLAFFSMRYIPVRFSKYFQFDGLTLTGKVPVQHGYLTDVRGNRWRLSYGLQHMGNGDWRIISTIIQFAPGDPT